MEERIISFIITGDNEYKINKCTFFINNLKIPNGYNTEIIINKNVTSIARSYNDIIANKKSKYKVYLKESVLILNTNFIIDILGIFRNKLIGIIGLAGTKQLPVSGNWWEAKSSVGEYFKIDNNEAKLERYNEVNKDFEKVQAVDGFIMATQYNFKWREDLFKDKYYYDTAQCLEYIKNGYDVVIPKQEITWAIRNDIDDIDNNIIREQQKVFLKNYELINLNKSNLYDFKSDVALEIISDNKKVLQGYLNKMKECLKNNMYNDVTRLEYEVGDMIFRDKHAGIFASDEIEGMLQKCAKSIVIDEVKKKDEYKGKRRILHILSEGYPTGGHTRLVKNWIESDSNSIHNLITTWQSVTLPLWLIDSVKNSGGEIISLDKYGSNMDRGKALRVIAEDFADIVVLHIHMFDPIPIIAFGVEGGPPVIFINHADHCFWIGSSISDIIVDLNKYGNIITTKRRGRRESYILPIPLMNPERIYIENKEGIRKKYNISEEKKIVLCIATEYKFNSVNDIDYCEIVKCILKNTKDTVFIIIGPENNGKFRMLWEISDERVLLLGSQNEIDEFYEIADLYLSSFNMSSFTSELDAIVRDIPVLKLKNTKYPKSNVMFDELELLSFETIGEVISCIESFERDKDNEVVKKAQEMKKFVLENNILKTSEYIEEIYSKVDNHHIYDLEINDEIDDYDLFWALFNH